MPRRQAPDHRLHQPVIPDGNTIFDEIRQIGIAVQKPQAIHKMNGAQMQLLVVTSGTLFDKSKRI